jgi:hypothetical protein
MNKEKFSSLLPKKRCDLVLEEGQFLDSVKWYRFKASLYAFNSFFVEVLCYQDSSEIVKVDVAREENLVKYLNRIDVSVLLGFKPTVEE